MRKWLDLSSSALHTKVLGLRVLSKTLKSPCRYITIAMERTVSGIVGTCLVPSTGPGPADSYFV